jgi:hypothetical protein
MHVLTESEFESIIQPYLTNEDDSEFWSTVFETLTLDFESLYSNKILKSEIFLQIGACSHWLRPHQTRWTAAGGFAAPVGYQGNSRFGSGLPELEWFVIFRRDQKEKRWTRVEKFYGKHKLICRVALPTRTLRHNQAAIQVIWSPGTPSNPDKKLKILYGFRKVSSEWKCVASDAQ